MEAKLSVEIGADVSKLTQGMANAATVVSSGASKIDKSTITLQRNLNNLNKTPFTFGQNFQRQSQIAAKGVNQLDNAVKKSRSNMQAWIYIIQDAPFGLMGIQNNLTQLIPGVGAASLAFSALISALTFSQVGMTYWNKGAKNTKDSADGLSGSVGTLNKALAEDSSVKEAYSNFNSLKINIDLAKEGVLSKKEVVEQYNETLSDTMGTLQSFEEVEKRITDAGPAYIKMMALRAAANLALDKSAEEFYKAEIERNKTAEEGNSWFYSGLKNSESGLKLAEKIKENRIKQIEDGAKQELSIAEKFQKEIAELSSKYGFDLYGVGKEKEIKRVTASELDYVKAIQDYNKEEKERISNISDYLAKLSGVNEINKNLTKEISLPKLSAPQALNIPIVSELDLAIMRIGEQASELKNNIAPLLTDAFYSLGEAINSGDFAGFGEGILRAMSGFIADLGQMFIKEGLMQIAAGIAKNVALPGSGMPNILSGKMLIAAGALGSVGAGLMGSTSMGKSSPGYQIPRFANGVTNFSGGTALVGERGPELVSLPTGSNVITNENIRRYGVGGGGQVFIPNMKIEGQDLVVVFDRASRNRNRIT